MLKDCGKTKIYVEELEGTSEIISNVKILIEEAKIFEKIMKTRLSRKESFCQKLKPRMEEVRSEEGSTCLTRCEIKKNYDGTIYSQEVKEGKQWIILNPNTFLHTKEMRRAICIIAQLF